jgi:hypothetical protein
VALESPKVLRDWLQELRDKHLGAKPATKKSETDAAFDYVDREISIARLLSRHRLDTVLTAKVDWNSVQKSLLFRELLHHAYLPLSAGLVATTPGTEPPGIEASAVRQAVANVLFSDPAAVATAKLAARSHAFDAWNLGILWTATTVLVRDYTPEQLHDRWSDLETFAELLQVEIPPLPEDHEDRAIFLYLREKSPGLALAIEQKHGKPDATLFTLGYDLMMLQARYTPVLFFSDTKTRDLRDRVARIEAATKSLSLPRRAWAECLALIERRAGSDEVAAAISRMTKEYHHLLWPEESAATTATSANVASKKPSIPQAKPASAPKSLFPKSDVEVWGYWKLDHFFYAGHIEKIDGTRALFRFDDGDAAWLSANEIIDVTLTVGMPVLGNWKQRNKYYQGHVSARNGKRIRIRYNDGDVEETTLAHVRLPLHPSEMYTTGRRVFARWAPDKLFYAGKIEKVDGLRYFVRYDDNQTAWVGPSDLALLQLYVGLYLEADAGRRGKYYWASVTRIDGEKVWVEYDRGGTEQTTVSALRRTLEKVNVREPSP